MNKPAWSFDRRRFRKLHSYGAIIVLITFLYFLLTHLGWVGGLTGSTSSLWLMGSSTALIWGLLLVDRNVRMAGSLILISFSLLVGALVQFVQEQ